MNAPATFTKRDPQAPVGFVEAEARGQRWLAQADGGVPVVGGRRGDHGHSGRDRLEAVAPSHNAGEALVQKIYKACMRNWATRISSGEMISLEIENMKTAQAIKLNRQLKKILAGYKF